MVELTMPENLPTVTLINWTPHPIEHMYIRWHASRTDDPLLNVEEVQLIEERGDPVGMKWLEQYRPHLHRASLKFGNPTELFAKILYDAVPVAEPIMFDFMFENVTVAFREQLVRHDEGFFSPTLWAQTSRARDALLTNFSKLMAEPDSVKQNREAHATWDQWTKDTSETFKTLLSLGISQDDARLVMPMAFTHRIAGAFTLRDLQRIVSKRTCWVAQASLWHPIIMQMVDQLVLKVHPLFKSITDPPCMSGGHYAYCPVQVDNRHRLDGQDPQPPCPIWMHQDWKKQSPFDDDEQFVTEHQKGRTYQNMKLTKPLLEQFSRLWRSEVQVLTRP